MRRRRSGKAAKLNAWHRLTVSRTGREAYITLDGGEEEASGGGGGGRGSLTTAPGAFTQLSLGQDLWLGGVSTPAILSAYLPITRGFRGCIQKVRL